MQLSSATSRHYGAIFFIALVTIATQILVSRIFSVTLYYHAAFASITLAMLGLTAGALKVYDRPDYFSAERADNVLAEYGSRFGLSLTMAVLLHAWLPGIADSWRNGISVVDALPVASLLGSMIFLLYAFIESGVCIALLLTRFPAQTSRLYAFDLTGAGLGCIVILLLLQITDPISALMLLSIFLGVMAWRFLSPSSEQKMARKVRCITLTLMTLTTLQLATSLHGEPIFHLTWAKERVLSPRPIFEKWNTYSRVAVMEHGSDVPFGWGYGVQPTSKIEQKFLNIDADAGTILTRFDGDLKKIRFLQDDIINLGYHVRDIDSVAVIGVGGGRDILSALAAGATRIQGIELNPSILQAITHEFGEFTGHLDQRPEVKLANAEARSFLNSHEDTYDLIQISLIDTWATTAAGGLTLSENKLYTTEAWEDFLDRLTDDGLLVVSRWYEPEIHRGEFYRMLSIASDAIRAHNPDADPRQHILVASVDRSTFSNTVVTVIVSKSPLRAKDVGRFTSTSKKLRFIPLLTPSFAVDDMAKTIASGEADQAFYDALPLKLDAPTDDKPFFFFMQRFFEDGSDLHHNLRLNDRNNIAIKILLGLILGTLAASCVFIGWPLVRLYKKYRVPVGDALPYMLYFSGIGLGFMLVEISQMQRLMIFLGHPVYGLSVVLFTLLLASGIGSYTQRNLHAASPRLWLKPVVLCMVLAVIGLAMPSLTEHLKYYDTAMRIVASIAIVGSMGFFMGMMFPVGVAVASVRHGHLLPWYWGINGAASVFASVLGVVLSLQYGISATYWIGIACYGLCVIALLMLRKR